MGVSITNETYWTSPIQHGAQVVLMVCEVLISRVPLVSHHVWLPVLYASLFQVFMWSYWGVTGAVQDSLWGADPWGLSVVACKTPGAHARLAALQRTLSTVTR